MSNTLGDTTMLKKLGIAFPDVVAAVVTKMVRRHPHVFGDEAGRMSPIRLSRISGSAVGAG